MAAALVATAFGLLAAQSAAAANDTWSGGGSPDGNWTNAANWDNLPVANDFLNFDTSNQLLATNDFSAGTIFGNLSFSSGAGSFTLSGNGVVLASPLENSGGSIFGGSVSNLSASTQIIGLPLTNSAGNHAVTTASGAGALDFSGAFARNNGTTIQYLKSGDSINYTGSGLANDSSGIIGAWAIIGQDYAALDGGQNVIANPTYTSANTGAIATGANVNYTSTGSGNLTTASGVTFNALRAHFSSSSRNLTITGTLTLGQHGGIYRDSNSSGTLTVTGGTLTAGTSAGAELTLINLNANSAKLIVNSVIADNAGGAVTVNALGSLNYGSANTYSGGTYLNFGEAFLSSGTANSFGTGPIHIYPGARADYGNQNGNTITNNFFIAGPGFIAASQPGAIKGSFNGSFTGAFTLMGDASIDPNAGGSPNTCTFSGPFTGTGSLTIGGANSGFVAGTATLGGTNNYTGDAVVDATANINGGAGIKISPGKNNIMQNGGNMNLIGGSSGVASFDLNGTTQTINGLTNTSGNAANAIVKSSAAGGVLVVGNNSTTSTFGGVIQNGGGTMALTKIGTGALTLTGANTYSGSTTISNGVLVLSGSLASSAQILISSTATFDVSQLGTFTLGGGQILGGNGVVTGGVTTASSSIISPGFGAGTLTFSNDLTLNSGNTCLFELSSTTNGANDQIIVAGNLNLAGATIQISAATLQLGRYKLIAYGLAESGTAAANLVLNYVPSGVSVALDDSIAGEIDLRVTPGAPETLTWNGDGVANVWDVNTTANWTNSGLGNLVFTNGSLVVFNDNGSKSPDVNVSTTVQPLSLLVSNNTGTYTFSGGGNITGGTALVKKGSGALVLNDTGGDNFSGGIVVQGGSLSLSNSSVNIAGNITVTNSSVTFANSGTISGNLNVQNNATVLLDQSATITGNTTISNSAMVQVGNNDTGGSLPSGTVNNNGTLIFNHTDDLNVANAISGKGTLIKTNSNALTLSTDNSTWTGAALVTQGTLKVGAVNAIGNGGTPITVSSGATLDFNGIANNLFSVTASGSGVGGNGAIVDNGADVYPVVTNITLAGDISIGGTGRWDLRSLGGTTGNPALATLNCAGGQPYNLMKTGNNFIAIVAATVDTNMANIDLQSGTLDIEGNTTGLGNPTNTLTVETGATLFFYQPTNQLNKVFVMKDGSWIQNSSGATALIGPVILSTNISGGPGDVNFNCGGTSLAFSNVISGPGNLNKVNGGQYLFLSATNTYTGNTVVNSGWLALVGNGSIATSPNIIINNNNKIDATFRTDKTFTLASDQTLSGTNSGIQGILVASAGSMIVPGGSNNVSTLTVSSNAVLAGLVVMDVDKTAGTNDVIAAGTTSSLTYGGTLVVTNLTAALANGDSFKLFNAGSYSGSFTAISPATPGDGLAWDTSSLTNDGILNVVSSVKPTPTITGISLSGTTLTLTATNGAANGDYVLLSSTNLALPLAQWTPVLTIAFDSNGNLNLSTNVIGPGTVQEFYILSQ